MITFIFFKIFFKSIENKKASPCGFFYGFKRILKNISFVMDHWLIDEFKNNVFVELMSVFV